VRRRLPEKGIAAKAEYRNLKGCMETGSLRMDKGTQEPTVRENVEEGIGRSRGLSSQNLNGAGRKKGSARGSIAWKAEMLEVR